MTAPADSSVSSKVLSIDHTLFVFSFIFPFIIDNCNYGSLLKKCLKMEIFLLFAKVYSKININVVQIICLGSNLSMHIRENTDFLW